MAQSTIIAAGMTQASSSAVEVAAGGRATFSVKSATAGQPIPPNFSIPIRLVQGASKTTIASLSRDNPTVVVDATGSYVAEREDVSQYGVSVEVLLDA